MEKDYISSVMQKGLHIFLLTAFIMGDTLKPGNTRSIASMVHKNNGWPKYLSGKTGGKMNKNSGMPGRIWRPVLLEHGVVLTADGTIIP